MTHLCSTFSEVGFQSTFMKVTLSLDELILFSYTTLLAFLNAGIISFHEGTWDR